MSKPAIEFRASDDVPWTPVAGATSPYSTVALGSAKFFRAQ